MGGHTEVPFAGRGEAPWREMELLVESGFTPLEAIAAATGTAAAFLYRSDEFGTLRPGLQADLVVLRDNPRRDITAIRTRRARDGTRPLGRSRSIREVLKNGTQSTKDPTETKSRELAQRQPRRLEVNQAVLRNDRTLGS